MKYKLIAIDEDTKIQLDNIKVHPRETYKQVINRLLVKVKQ